ncbi:MAG: class I SAM-dependent methyltransferase [Pseudonocardiaceae bacterium]
MNIVDRAPICGLFSCPACLCRLDLNAARSDCSNCGAKFLREGKVVDFLPQISPPNGLGIFYVQDPLLVARYEVLLRPAFLKIMGSNWSNTITEKDEHDYLRAHVCPAGGPVLDLACGAGRWTLTLVDMFGPENVVGLDVSKAMTEKFTSNLPNVCIARANATALPYSTGHLGAINCWNAFQLLPDPWGALSEMARVIANDGTLTLFTYRTASRPLQRYFQLRHEAAFNVRAFHEDTLRNKMLAAGFEISDWQAINTFLFVTAKRARA